MNQITMLMRYYLLVFLFHSFLLIGCNKKFVHKQSSETTTSSKSLTIIMLAQTKKSQIRTGLRHILYVKPVSAQQSTEQIRTMDQIRLTAPYNSCAQAKSVTVLEKAWSLQIAHEAEI
jgi:hypothetical protein